MVEQLLSGIWVPKGHDEVKTADQHWLQMLQRLETANILGTTTKIKERSQHYRKGLIQLRKFFNRVSRWQRERTSLSVANRDLELLVVLLLGEIKEVLEHRQLEGSAVYDFESEKGEAIDVAFFIASLTFLLNQQGQQIDFDQVIHRANGQSNNSSSMEKLTEVGGNLSEKSLGKDLEYLWILWVSYIIHMKYSVDPNQVLTEYTFPKNNGNYVAKLLASNPLFERVFGREMDEDEHKAYFAHYREATRLIRDFIISFVDPSVEHTGLREMHYINYKKYIYSFISELGYGPDQALAMIAEELYNDYGIQKTESGILVAKSLAFMN